MQEYLQIKIGNDSNETMTINLTNYDRAKTDQEIKNAMDQILQTEVFKGKTGLYNKKISADIVTVDKKPMNIQ
ncbi:MAG: DUF2922 domain-containing protein [Finegoldia magna]|uniref:DUF2922 domain-containing protein n=1 Tax=Finegoldia magna TaxID=1260 RepID=UPI000B91C291|nr:DUF2922 domain-containing protein [Finegoldia magna]MDU5808996.1 DUF2922 domain-containing protein [Finegoldia magna]OXZ29852.1 hypothetical protein B9N57_08610 [Finegoldia magna]